MKMCKNADNCLEYGSKVVSLVDTQHQKVEVYTVDDTEIFGSGDILEIDDLLPDFKLPVTSLWSQAE